MGRLAVLDTALKAHDTCMHSTAAACKMLVDVWPIAGLRKDYFEGFGVAAARAASALRRTDDVSTPALRKLLQHAPKRARDMSPTRLQSCQLGVATEVLRC